MAEFRTSRAPSDRIGRRIVENREENWTDEYSKQSLYTERTAGFHISPEKLFEREVEVEASANQCGGFSREDLRRRRRRRR